MHDSVEENEPMNKHLCYGFDQEEFLLSVMSIPKQGMDVFLRNLTGLDEELYPVYIPVYIHNHQQMKPGEVRGEITFLSEQLLLERVKRLLSEIAQVYPDLEAMSYEDICFLDLLRIKSRIARGDDRRWMLFSNLWTIVTHSYEDHACNGASVEELAGSRMLTLTDPEEIKKYIHWGNYWRHPDQEVEYYSAYYAVDHVDLYCAFPVNVGSVCVAVDTANQFKSVWNPNVETGDAFIVIHKPDSGIRSDDLSLFEWLRSCGIDPKKTFYLANVQDDDHKHDAFSYVHDIKAMLQVADCRGVNVRDREAVTDYMKFVVGKLREILPQQGCEENCSNCTGKRRSIRCIE